MSIILVTALRTLVIIFDEESIKEEYTLNETRRDKTWTVEHLVFINIIFDNMIVEQNPKNFRTDTVLVVNSAKIRGDLVIVLLVILVNPPNFLNGL